MDSNGNKNVEIKPINDNDKAHLKPALKVKIGISHINSQEMIMLM